MLCFWQTQRLEWKNNLIESINSNYNSVLDEFPSNDENSQYEFMNTSVKGQLLIGKKMFFYNFCEISYNFCPEETCPDSTFNTDGYMLPGEIPQFSILQEGGDEHIANYTASDGTCYKTFQLFNLPRLMTI